MEDKTNEGNTKLSSIYRHITASIPDQKCPPNKINNQKYTLITFIPKIFWSQVSQFFDFVIFAMIVVQLFPKYQVQPISASLAPWLMIILLVSYKEGTQDYSRYTKDLIVNSQKYVIYRNIKGKLDKVCA